MDENGAGDRTRTYDPIITNDVLYQLSYSGTCCARSCSAATWLVQDRKRRAPITSRAV